MIRLILLIFGFSLWLGQLPAVSGDWKPGLFQTLHGGEESLDYRLGANLGEDHSGGHFPGGRPWNKMRRISRRAGWSEQEGQSISWMVWPLEPKALNQLVFPAQLTPVRLPLADLFDLSRHACLRVAHLCHLF